jgi:cytochrome c biogenesis protein CcmG, thiol:disulfide interchange protein DsbE
MKSQRHLRHALRSLAAAAVLALAAPAFAAAAGESPGLDLRGLDGKPFSLDSLHGRVVLLDFWAPWCIPCRKSFPFLQTLQDRHAGAGLSVVGLTLDSDSEAIREFVDETAVTFPIVTDPSEKSGEVFGVVAMPTTLLLDRAGQVVARFEGGGEEVHRKIEQAVAPLLAGGTVRSGADVRVAASLAATGQVKAWRRGVLADPIMALDGDVLTQLLRDHVYASKEAAAGSGGAAGGGCGCN